MRTAKLLGLVAALVHLAALELPAQVPTIAPGVILRLKSTAVEACTQTPCVGRLVSVTPDEYVLMLFKSAQTLTVPRASITDLDIKTGEHRHGLAGGLIGTAVGLLAVMSYTVATACIDCESASNDGVPAGFTMSLMLIVPMAVGHAIGHGIVSDAWEQVPPDRYSLGVGYMNGGPAIAFSIAF